jgi:AcrR family transcriptional regulator
MAKRLEYHHEMVQPYELTGRTRQKQRTRDALVETASRLLAGGVTPSVEQVAEQAGVSRPTAYRYFPNQRALLVAIQPRLDAASLLPEDAPADPRERLLLVVSTYTGWLVEREPQLRTSLRLSLDTPAGQDRLRIREGRAVGWISDALAPLADRLAPEQLRQLATAIRSAVGIEALVWLVDVAGMSRPDAVDLMHWSALAMYDAALGPLGTPPIASR